MKIIIVVLIALFALTIPVIAQNMTAVTDAEAMVQEADKRFNAAVEGLKNVSDANLAEATAELENARKNLKRAKNVLAALTKQSSTEIAQPLTDSIDTPTERLTLTGADRTSPTEVLNSNGNTNSSVTSTSTVNTSSNSTTTAASQTVDCNNDRSGVYSIRLCNIAKDAAKLTSPQIRLMDSRFRLLTVIYGKIIDNGKVSVDDAQKKFILDAEEKRTDKQVGADSSGKGTTSIVVKGGIPGFLNFAAENGAATRSISGTTLTFRFNPVGLLQTLTGQDYIESFQSGFRAVSKAKKIPPGESQAFTTDNNQFTYESRAINYFRKLSVGLSFDAGSGNETPTIFGDGRQLSVFSMRYEFFNERDPRHPKYAETWRNFFTNQGGTLIKDLTDAETTGIFLPLRRGFINPDLQRWFEQTNAALGKLPAGSSVEAIEQEIKNQLELLPVDKIKSDTALLAAFANMTKAFIDFNDQQQVLLNEIAKAPVMTLEYTNKREQILPDTHNFNFILAKGFSLGSGNDAPVMDFTFNASLTFLNKKPAGTDVKRIRDFSFAAQHDVPLFSTVEDRERENTLYGTLLSFAGRYQRLTDDLTDLDGTVLPDTKGDIWVGQAKLVIPLNFGFLKGKGIRFPISATWANRTELVKESRIRGNFGITFDLDKLILNELLDNMR